MLATTWPEMSWHGGCGQCSNVGRDRHPTLRISPPLDETTDRHDVGCLVEGIAGQSGVVEAHRRRASVRFGRPTASRVASNRGTSHWL
jgi:hypothetical protein